MKEIIEDLYNVLTSYPSEEVVQKLLNRIGYWEAKEGKTKTLEAVCYLLLTEHLKARYAVEKPEKRR